MDKNNLKNIALALAVVLLAWNGFCSFQMKQELAALNMKLASMDNRVSSDIWELKSVMQGRFDQIEEAGRREQSLFSETGVDIRVQEGKLKVTMRGVPKALAAGETLLARITADGQIYEKEVDKAGQAEFLIDIAGSIQPVFVLQSDEGIRQESLEEQFTEYLFRIPYQASWNEEFYEDNNRLRLDLSLYPGEYGLPFSDGEVETAEFVVVSSGIEESSDGVTGTAAEVVTLSDPAVRGSLREEMDLPQGDTVLARKAADSLEGCLTYTADFSEYAARMDGILYEIYFVLTTKDGMQYYTDANSAASFSMNLKSRGLSNGSDQLTPVFP